MKQMTAVDFVNVVAPGNPVEENGISQIVGGGRYVRIGPWGSGKARRLRFSSMMPTRAFLVFGSGLFKHPVSIARESGITRF